MANPWAFEATQKRFPRATSDTLIVGPNVRRSAIGVASAADAIINGTLPELGCWVTMIADVDCYVHVQSSTVADIAASATVSFLLPANTPIEGWAAPKYDDRVVFIRRTIDGNLYRFMSNH